MTDSTVVTSTPCSRRNAAVPPDDVREQVEKQFLRTVWEDVDIWRYQEYVERPPLSKADAKAYMALRRWATQFYEVPPRENVVASP